MRALAALLGSVPFLLGICFPTGNGFKQDNVPCQNASILLEWCEEHKHEFQLISWSSNTEDLNLIEQVWIFVDRQLRDQTSSCRYIWTLRDHCLAN
ncbi:transposable element Tc1 transposase [Trichonephila clavipes]|nr:transposable element Tc1 transposase [Trichonephila clavipes]